MASSDEDGEIVPNCVTDYYFLNDEDEFVSFAALPLRWRHGEFEVGSENHVFLFATATEDVRQKVHKRVVAWKFDLSFLQPVVSVLSKDMKWIALEQPRKSFESTVRTVLVTLHWLQFLKKNPETTRRDLWNHLLRAFSSFEVEPSGLDLFDHMLLVTIAVKRDSDLAKCKNPLMLMERPSDTTDPREHVQVTKNSFIVETEKDDHDRSNDEGFNGDDEFYDHVCALCDNGGEILSCQGRCMRSFHATINAGAGYCESLGFQDDQIKAIPTFMCPNCTYKQHQCFVCGKLGFSDDNDRAEVFPCISATCGHFYHPKCVAQLLEPANKRQAKELEDRIAARESFACPVHKCFICSRGEDKKVHELQFAICRRCPRAYHRKCLPGNISFERNYTENIFQRAWENLLPNRILIYCMDHDIIRELETPTRDHIQFPNVHWLQKLHNFGSDSRETRIQVSSNVNENFLKQIDKGIYGPNTYDSSPNVAYRIARSSKENIGPSSRRLFPKRVSKLFLQRNNSSMNLKTSLGKSKVNITSVVGKQTTQFCLVRKAHEPSYSSQADMENRILALIKEASSSFNREDFMKKQKLAATYDLFSMDMLENAIPMGKVEGSIKAIQTAVKKLEEGHNTEEAKAVCEPEILDQVFNWKRKLSIYLAPFLHGMRYTSFGRHFTKMDKLKEVVNRLHCYVKNGDTIVDFCCGSNDFSVLMKNKLEKKGKHCFFKNFDLIMAKNDFCFEQRDWMSVKPEELPMGSQLIMGLNPPFGSKASLANKFINKALQFGPKLLILIVPEETQRVDEKRIPYDLIWVDKVVLSGKSFYLPGSVDSHNKRLEDWNMKPPPLYLWSRRDWTLRHEEIAREHGHISREPSPERNNLNHDGYQDYYSLHKSDDVSSMFDEFLDDTDEDEPQDSGSNVEGHAGRDTDMCTDVEISSPRSSPTCHRALHEVFGTPESEEEETESGYRYEWNKQSYGYITSNDDSYPEINYHGSSST